MTLFIKENCNLQEFKLSDSHVDVWLFPLTSYPDIALLLLDENELQRAHRFYFERHRRRFIASHAALRLILSQYLKQEPEKINYVYAAHGKPGIESLSSIEFNLSHSGEIGLLAVGKTHPLGADIEIFSQRSYLGLAKHSFSPIENQCLMTCPPYLEALTFFTIWAQKEAFIKASGLGLSYPTQVFTVAPHQGQTLAYDKLHQQSWQLYSYMPRVGYCAALCLNEKVTNLNKFQLNDLTILVNK